jgi:copper oxidase (laccase) domain-containing protein
MEALGADRGRIVAAIGPCIGRASYEVDDGFRLRFEAEAPDNERFFREGRRIAHHQFDIEAYVAHRLAASGLRGWRRSASTPMPIPTRFFSFRRTTHRGEPDYGRQISVIAVPA